ncbi:MAG: LuxR C-terminal-related transcriptional regulator, partial [Catenulispora sp.]
MIAEDSGVLRDGLVQILTKRGHEVPTAVPDADALLAAVAAGPPDAVVLDIRMPPTHTDEGLRAALKLRKSHPKVGVLLFSQYVETRYARDLFSGNASGVGYLLKERVADVSDFVQALVTIANGGTVLDPEVVVQLLGSQPTDALTAREREVLALMAEGRSNGAIAAELVVSAGAVEKHVSSIFTKLDLAPAETDHRRVLAVLRYL